MYQASVSVKRTPWHLNASLKSLEWLWCFTRRKMVHNSVCHPFSCRVNVILFEEHHGIQDKEDSHAAWGNGPGVLEPSVLPSHLRNRDQSLNLPQGTCALVNRKGWGKVIRSAILWGPMCVFFSSRCPEQLPKTFPLWAPTSSWSNPPTPPTPGGAVRMVTVHGRNHLKEQRLSDSYHHWACACT